jgi:hypothetical protein
LYPAAADLTRLLEIREVFENIAEFFSDASLGVLPGK